MAKKRYISPLFSGGLDDGGSHTEPYTNSEDIYTPDDPGNLYPDFSGLNEDQMLMVLSLTSSQAWAMDTDHDGVISLAEYLDRFPQ